MKRAKIICRGKAALRRDLMNLEDSRRRAGVFGDARQAAPGFAARLGSGFNGGFQAGHFGLITVIHIVKAVASLSTFGMLQNMEVSRMKKGKLFFIILLGILSVASASWAQTVSRPEGATNSRDADSPVVNVYGPDVLTDLAGQAIQEKRPDVVIVQNYKSLKNKVLIEGTTGSGYMPLSPKRVGLLQAAKARGGSVYSALCSEQKRVIKKTVGMKKVVHRVERREYRTETREYYVQRIYPPPPAVYVPPAGFGFGIGGYHGFYGHRGYGRWGYGRYPYSHYRGWRGHRSFHTAHRGHYHSGSFHRGHR